MLDGPAEVNHSDLAVSLIVIALMFAASFVLLIAPRETETERMIREREKSNAGEAYPIVYRFCFECKLKT